MTDQTTDLVALEVAQILADHAPVADGCTCGDIYPAEPHDGHLTALLANWHDARVTEALEPIKALADGTSGLGVPFTPSGMTTPVVHLEMLRASLAGRRSWDGGSDG